MKLSRPSTRFKAFFFLTFAWSRTCWLLSPAIEPQSNALATMLMFAGSFGPSMTAVLVAANVGGRAGLRICLGRCLRWRIGWGWTALAMVLPAALKMIAAGLHVALGGSMPLSPVANSFLVLALGGPLGEEFG